MRLTCSLTGVAWLISGSLGCSHDSASSSGPSPALTSPSSVAAAPVAAPSGVASPAGASDGTDPGAPALSPDDATFVDARRGLGWGDRCFAEIPAG